MTSTKLPTCTFAPRSAPGAQPRERADLAHRGDRARRALPPSMWVYGWIIAPAPIVALRITQFAPTRDVVAELDPPFEDAVDVDLDIGAAHQLAAQVEARRVGQPHAGFHQRVGLAPLHAGARARRAAFALLTPSTSTGSRGCVATTGDAVVDGGHRDDVGQVVLALRVVVAQGGEPALQRRASAPPSRRCRSRGCCDRPRSRPCPRRCGECGRPRAHRVRPDRRARCGRSRVGSSSSTVSSASRLPSLASTSACAVAASISGTSPFRISVVPSSPSHGTACCTAWPVPSCGSWRANTQPRARDGRLDRVGAVAGDHDDAARPQPGRGLQNMLQ